MEFNKPEGYKSINSGKTIVIGKISYIGTVKRYFTNN